MGYNTIDVEKRKYYKINKLYERKIDFNAKNFS